MSITIPLKQKKLFVRLFCLTFPLSFISAIVFAQSYAAIDDAILKKDLATADNLLQQKINGFIAQRNADSLNNCIEYVGKLEKEKTNADEAVKKVTAFIETIKTLNPSVPALAQSHIDAGEFYGSISKNDLAYKSNKQAFDIAVHYYKNATAKLGSIQSNMGTYAQRLGNVSLSEQHQRQALRYLTGDPKAEQESLYISYNNMGSILWYASQLDSAIYFFDKALAALKKTEATPINQFYRSAVVENNIAGIYSLKGKTTKAIEAMQSCIVNLKKFLATKEPHSKKTTAITFQLEATDNLAGIYKELGDYKKAYELLNYSYSQKQQKLDKDDAAIFISQILLGQLHYATKELDKAERFLQQGLLKISKADGDYLFWQADACNTLALLYNEKNDLLEASFYYAKADSLYNASLQGDYDNIYLEFISNQALFYAKDLPAVALAKATKAYNYAVANSGVNTLTASAQLLNLAEVSYLSGNYSKSLQYSNEALNVVKNITRHSGNALDSVKTELRKPKIILQKTKAQYAQLTKKDASTLSPLIKELDEAITSLERRKSILTDATDINLLMADQTELLAFTKKLNLDLYKASNDKGYLEKLIQLHESSVYNRIRSRLDKTSDIQFAKLSPGTIEKEKSLKAAIGKALEGTGSHDAKMQAYIKATDEWNSFRESLQKSSPEYFQMRYASIIKPLKNILPSLPEGTNVIRYFFVDQELLAFVADNKQQNIVLLGQPSLKTPIEKLSSFSADVQQTGNLLFELYNQLWAPLAKHISQKNIIIIPDGVLYSLSFELLTPEKISSFKELAVKSNMARYGISYNYSLFNLEPKTKPVSVENSFIGFAPGFSDELKQKFKTTARDSTKWDAGYFSLLPQPFSTSLASKTYESLGGNIYLHDASTKVAFQENAGNHRIIHLGTHAEANNLYPEYSRLIFAKNPSTPEASNSLYLSEIYNCNLNSELAVLTACESGQPGYEDGEGMVSMAHAFNYAGSQSIITGLWKIDEQASAILIEEFYKNLQHGMTKDEALRQAKVFFLQNADGRMLAPAYWAGLVLMGDTKPVDIKEPSRGKLIWIGVGVLALLSICLLLFRRKNNSK
jgi:CHAT domain-containing protein